MTCPWVKCKKPGRIRDTFIGLSQESAALGQKLGIEFKEDMVEYNLKSKSTKHGSRKRYRFHSKKIWQKDIKAK